MLVIREAALVAYGLRQVECEVETARPGELLAVALSETVHERCFVSAFGGLPYCLIQGEECPRVSTLRRHVGVGLPCYLSVLRVSLDTSWRRSCGRSRRRALTETSTAKKYSGFSSIS